MSGAFVEAGHLGGFVQGGDEATFFPELWEWLVNEQGVRSVIDVGCGEGQALDHFRRLGCRVLGIEGVPQPDEAIVEHDYTTGPVYWPDAWRPGWSDLTKRPDADLVWSCEFVEHVEERYVPNFLATFACADLVLMTHAEPGQEGYHHVNCQPEAYWRGALAAIGYTLDHGLTTQMRRLAAVNPSPWNHYARSGLAFRRA